MSVLDTLLRAHTLNTASGQDGLNRIKNFAGEQRMKALTAEFMNLPDKSERGIQDFATRNRLKPEELNTVVGMAGSFMDYAQKRKTQKARDDLTQILSNYQGGEASPELRGAISNYAAQGNANDAFAIMQAQGITKPMNEREKALNDLKMKVAETQLANAQTPKKWEPTTKEEALEYKRAGAVPQGQLTQYQRNNLFDKRAKEWISDQLMSSGYTFTDGRWMKDGVDVQAKDAIQLKGKFQSQLAQKRQAYMSGESLDSVFGQPASTGVSTTTSDLVNAGKGSVGKQPEQPEETGGTGFGNFIQGIMNKLGADKRGIPDTLQPAHEQRKPQQGKESQYDKVWADKDGTIWGASGGQTRRIAVKPPEKIYNNKYDNPEYQKYLELKKKYNLQ